MKKLVLQLVVLLLLVGLIPPLSGQQARATVPGEYLFQWGAQYYFINEHGVSAYGVAVDLSGNVYVANTGYDTILVYNNAGKYLFSIGSTGAGDGGLSAPEAVALDESGNVYVADTGNRRISVFTSSGTFLRNLGPAAEYSRLTVGGNGNVYAINRYDRTVYILNSAGQLLRSIGNTGFPNALYFTPTGVAVDASGNIYVADQGNATIQVFNGDGIFLGRIGRYGTEEGELSILRGVTLDSAGQVYVPTPDASIVVFTTAGAYVRTIRSSSTGNVFRWQPDAVAVDQNGKLYAVDFFNGSIEIFDRDGTQLARWASRGIAPGEFTRPAGLALDKDLNLYVADAENRRVQVFSNSGQFLRFIGTPGNQGQGHLADVYDVAVARNGTTYVADTLHHMVQVFAADGTFLRTQGAGDLEGPSGLALDRSENLYVSDSGHNRIQVYSSTGAFLRTIGSSGTGPGQLNSPHGLDIDGSGNLYVADQFNHRIQVFNSAGVYQRTIGSFGSGQGQLNHPNHVALDQSGNLYVTDSMNDRVVVFSTTGTFLAQWGSNGFGNGEFRYPRGIAVDGKRVFVSDGTNNRIQVFAAYGAVRFGVSAPTAATAGSPFSFTVQALDWNNRMVTGYTGKVHFSSTDRFATLPPDTTLTGGVGTFSATFRNAGSHTLWAAQVGNNFIAGSSAPIQVAAASRVDLRIAKSHTGNFAQGQKRGVYTIRVTNGGTGPTSGQVNVIDKLPFGLWPVSLGGPGWSCNRQTLTCTRKDVLAAGASYPPIEVAVSVLNNAPSSVTNTATVSGGGDATTSNNIASDPTTITRKHHGVKRLW